MIVIALLLLALIVLMLFGSDALENILFSKDTDQPPPTEEEPTQPL
ncbi:hypothetical protein ACIQU5_34680 [Streptomyces sp. NPDC090306]